MTLSLVGGIHTIKTQKSKEKPARCPPAKPTLRLAPTDGRDGDGADEGSDRVEIGIAVPDRVRSHKFCPNWRRGRIAAMSSNLASEFRRFGRSPATGLVELISGV